MMTTLFEVQDGKAVVTTSTGWVVECQPVGDLLLRIGANLPLPEEPLPPTYTIVDAAGEEVERHHDAKSIEQKATPEEKDAWVRYVADRAAYDAAEQEREDRINQMRGRFMVMEGIVVRDMPDGGELEGWAKRQREWYGIETGLGEDEVRFAFIDQRIVRTPEDGMRITAGILYASGLSEEAIDQVEATFRDSLAGVGRVDLEPDQDDIGKEEGAA